ncbi:hypothetical protein QOT17_025445 [Balamuthia mandrillaris]
MLWHVVTGMVACMLLLLQGHSNSLEVNEGNLKHGMDDRFGGGSSSWTNYMHDAQGTGVAGPDVPAIAQGKFVWLLDNLGTGFPWYSYGNISLVVLSDGSVVTRDPRGLHIINVVGGVAYSFMEPITVDMDPTPAVGPNDTVFTTYVDQQSGTMYTCSLSRYPSWSTRWCVPYGGIGVSYDKVTDSVVSSSTNGTVFALRAATGTIDWQYQDQAAVRPISHPVRDADGRFYAVFPEGFGSRLVSVNPNEGKPEVAWMFEFMGVLVHGPMVTLDSRHIILITSYCNSTVLAVNIQTGKLAWKAALPTYFCVAGASLGPDKQTLFLSTYSSGFVAPQNFTAFSLILHKPLWSTSVPGEPFYSIGSPVATQHGLAYLQASSSLIAVNYTSKKVQWVVESGGSYVAVSPPAISLDGSIYCLTKGNTIWQVSSSTTATLYSD